MPTNISTSDSAAAISTRTNWFLILLNPDLSETNPNNYTDSQELSDVIDYIRTLIPAGARGATGNTGTAGTDGTDGVDGAAGDKGWSPIIAIESDGNRDVAKLVGWTGGEGATPTVPTNPYLTSSGFGTKSNAEDIRGRTGLQGAQGVYDLFIYRASATKPSRPTGGRINVSTGTVTNVPTGWNANIPDSDDKKWGAKVTINPASQSGTITPTWSDSYELGGTGPAGRQGDQGERGLQGIQGIQGLTGDQGERGLQGLKGDKGDTGESISVQFSTNGTSWHNTMASDDTYIRFRTGTAAWGAGKRFIGIDGIDGEDGEDGVGVTSITDANNDGTAVILYTDGSNADLPLPRGIQGVQGVSYLRIYRRSATALTTAPVGGTVDVSSGTVTPPSGWSAPSPPNGTDDLYFCETEFNPATQTADYTPVWNDPAVIGEPGVDGIDGYNAMRGDWSATTTYEQYDFSIYNGEVFYRFGARIIGNAANGNPAADSDWYMLNGADATLPSTVTQTQAEAGTGTDALMWTPQRVNQAIQALDPGTSFNDETLRTLERLQDIAGEFTYGGDVDDRWSVTARTGWGMVAHVPSDISAYITALTAASAATDYAAGTAFTSLSAGLASDSVVILEIPNIDARQIDDARVRMYDDTVSGSPNHYLHFSGFGGFNYLGVSGTNRYYYLEIASGWKLQLQHKLAEYDWRGGVEADEVVEAFTLDPGATLPASAISGIEATPASGAEVITLDAVTLTAATTIIDADIDADETDEGTFLSSISGTSVTVAEGTYLMEVTFAASSVDQRAYPMLLMRNGTDVVGRSTSQYFRGTDTPQSTTLIGVLNLDADTALRPAFVQLQYGTSLGGIGGAITITAGATITLHPFSSSGVTIGGGRAGDSSDSSDSGGTSGSGTGQIKRELVGEQTNRINVDPDPDTFTLQPSNGRWYDTRIEIPDSDDILVLEITDVDGRGRLLLSPRFTTGKILRALTSQVGSVRGTNRNIVINASGVALSVNDNISASEETIGFFGITAQNTLLFGTINDSEHEATWGTIRVWRIYADISVSSSSSGDVSGDDLTSLQAIIKEVNQLRTLTDDITTDYDSAATEWSVVPSSITVGARFVVTASLPADADAMNTYIAADESRSPDVPEATDDGWRYDGYLLFRVLRGEDISKWRVAFQDNHSSFDWQSAYLPLGSFSPVGQDSSNTYDIYSIYDGQWPGDDSLAFERQGTAVLGVWHGEYDDDRLQAALSRSAGRQSEDPYLPQNSGSLSSVHVAWGGGHNPLVSDAFAAKQLDFDIITPADAVGLGFDTTGSRIVLGSHDHKRGQLSWWDSREVADPNRIIMQFTITAAADTEHDYVIGIATNSPSQPANAQWRGWDLFDSGIVLAYIPEETGLTGTHAFYMMAASDGVTASDSNWINHTARLDAGGWQAVDGVARVTPSTTDAKANARLGMTGTTRLDGSARKSIAIEHFDRQTHLYINRALIGVWNWSEDRAPFRSGRNRGDNYLVRSTAYERTMVSGTLTSPITHIYEFSVSPARVQAASPSFFR